MCATLLVCCGGMLLLHLTAFLQDPGYTPLPAAGDAGRWADGWVCVVCCCRWRRGCGGERQRKSRDQSGRLLAMCNSDGMCFCALCDVLFVYLSCVFTANAEEGLYARHLAATANNTNSSASSSHQQGASSPAAAGAAAPAASEQTPLLGHAAAATIKQQQQQGGSASGSGGGAAASGGAQQQQQQPAWGGLPMDHCWTCRVKRNMRSKHCPLCK